MGSRRLLSGSSCCTGAASEYFVVLACVLLGRHHIKNGSGSWCTGDWCPHRLSCSCTDGPRLSTTDTLGSSCLQQISKPAGHKLAVAECVSAMQPVPACVYVLHVRFSPKSLSTSSLVIGHCLLVCWCLCLLVCWCLPITPGNSSVKLHV